AADLDHGADTAVVVHVRRDQALAGAAAGALARRGDALLAQGLDGRLHVASGLDQGVAAVHHSRLGAVAQLLDVCGGRLVVVHWASSPAGCASAAAASAGAATAAGAASAAGSAGASAAGSAGASAAGSAPASPAAAPSPASPSSGTKSDTLTPRFLPSAIASASSRTI